ncbi:hypothetical protein NX059_004504 [Plenodomus lindquistii]|nr:hypothetical protein NX059_004504 [Plenodomus lindquistii]
MDTALFFLFLVVLLGWYLVETDTISFPSDFDFDAAAAGPQTTSPPSSASASAAGPHTPPPSSRAPSRSPTPPPPNRRTRRQRSRASNPAPPSAPTFLSPAASPFAVSTPVVSINNRCDTFINVAWEERFGSMVRVCDPIKGWEWRAKAPEVLENMLAQADKGMGPLCDPRRRVGAVPIVDPAPRVKRSSVLSLSSSSSVPVSRAPISPPPVPVSPPAPAPPVDNRTVLEMLAGIPKLSFPAALPAQQSWSPGGMALAPSATGHALAGYHSSMAAPQQQQQQQQQQYWAPPPPPPQQVFAAPPPPPQQFSAPPPPPPSTFFSAPAFAPPPMAPPSAFSSVAAAPPPPPVTAAGQPSASFSFPTGPAFPPKPAPSPRRTAATAAPLYDADGSRAPVSAAPVKSVASRSSAANANANAGRVGRKPVPRPSGAKAPVLLR